MKLKLWYEICGSVFFYSLMSFVNGMQQPNFIVFIADDLGIGDVGCFGNDTIRTPNIDRLAKQGATLTHHLAAAAVCTPSRAALLTGRYPVRAGMEAANRNKVLLFVASSGGLPSNETTFAKILQREGYATALIGKWHLGNDCEEKGDICHHPLNHGFDYYYGIPLTNLKDFGTDGDSVITAYIPNLYIYVTTLFVLLVSLSLSLFSRGYIKSFKFLVLITLGSMFFFYVFVINYGRLNSVILRNVEVIEQPVRLNGLTQRLVQEGTDFMKQNSGKPFLLVMSFIHVHTALFSSPEFAGQSRHGRYGDNVEELDFAVGKIMAAAESLGRKEDIFTYFTSDNGGHLEERGVNGDVQGGYNGIYKGGKAMGGMEGGIRVPTVVSWPGKIPAKLRVSAPTSQMDVLPTMLEAAGIPLPNDRMIDGKSILPLLLGKQKQSPHQYLFHYCGAKIHAARYIPATENAIWKVHYATPQWKPGTTQCDFICHCFDDFVIYHNPPLLYNILDDPSEDHPIDVGSSPKWLKLITTINKAVKQHQNSIEHVPQQFTFFNSIWKPWLQPCCNFPWCQCVDERYPM